MKKKTMRAADPRALSDRQDLREDPVSDSSRRLSRVVFSSGKDDWQTPPELFAALNREFRFTLDVAATAENTLCDEWCEDGLSADWRHEGGACWCNPPYSRGLQKQFIAAAAYWQQVGVTTVMLLPARTDTQAFHRYIWNTDFHCPRRYVEVRFLRGRLKFVGAENSAPFPSMVVVFHGIGLLRNAEAPSHEEAVSAGAQNLFDGETPDAV